jgi:hypothetical protein
MEHRLYLSVPLFEALSDGRKTCKVVRARLGEFYSIGDTIKVISKVFEFTGETKTVYANITFVEPLAPVDCPEVYFILSLKLI